MRYAIAGARSQASSSKRNEAKQDAQRKARELQLEELGALAAEELAAADASTKDAGRHMLDALQHARAAGDAVNTANAKVKHGEFGPWLERHRIARSTATLVMRLARGWKVIEAEIANGSNLTLKGAAALVPPLHPRQAKSKPETVTPAAMFTPGPEVGSLPEVVQDYRPQLCLVPGAPEATSQPSRHERLVADLFGALRHVVALGLSRDVWAAVEEVGRQADSELLDLIRQSKQLLVSLHEHVGSGQ